MAGLFQSGQILRQRRTGHGGQGPTFGRIKREGVVPVYQHKAGGAQLLIIIAGQGQGKLSAERQVTAQAEGAESVRPALSPAVTLTKNVRLDSGSV